MKRKKLYYLSVLITFIALLLIASTIDSYALTFFDTEEEFLSSEPIASTETFNEYIPTTDGILPFTFSGTIFDDDIADPRLWRIDSQPYGLGIPTTSNVLFSPSVQDDYFSFGTNNYVNAFGFFLFHPYDEQTVGGLIYIDVIEIDGQVSTYVHNQDDQWLFFGFISSEGIRRVKVYNSTEDGILDTNYAYDNISRSEILIITEPLVSCVATVEELETALVQAAINERDDIIKIRQGTYIGNFLYNAGEFEPFNLTIEGGYKDPHCKKRVVDPAKTVLDAQNSGTVLVLSAPDVAADLVVDGLTIQIGEATGNFGGGLYAYTRGANVTLTNNIINDNIATAGGGGVFVDCDGIVTLTNNIISNNTANGKGGGVFLNGPVDTLNLTNNIISNNTANGDGGGVDFNVSRIVTLTNNIISNNTAICGGGVGFNHSLTVTLTNNIISNNTASGTGPGSGRGGGIFFFAAQTVTLTNNTISYNTGAGVWAELYSDTDIANIYNNIIWNNNAPVGSDLYIMNDWDNNGTPSPVNLFNNDFDLTNGIFIQDDISVVYADNLDNVDPQFDIDGYHLTDISPCIDAGATVSEPTDDIDGDSRPQGAGYDIGADEYVVEIITIDDIIDFFKQGVNAGKIEGRGRRPWIANARLWTFRQMLESAKRQLERGRTNRACRTLNRIERRCDGEPKPKDFITGDPETMEDLLGMLNALMETECN